MHCDRVFKQNYIPPTHFFDSVNIDIVRFFKINKIVKKAKFVIQAVSVLNVMRALLTHFFFAFIDAVGI